MADSLKNSPFTSLGNFNDNVLNDDYYNGNLETWKFKAKTEKGAQFNMKAKFNITKKDNIL